jgi:hypothetical protein
VQEVDGFSDSNILVVERLFDGRNKLVCVATVSDLHNLPTKPDPAPDGRNIYRSDEAVVMTVNVQDVQEILDRTRRRINDLLRTLRLVDVNPPGAVFEVC